MKTISLICTVHEERGRANVSELVAILNRIQPEVIFLELPPSSMDPFFTDRTKSNLESIAVSRYRVGRDALLVPVDLPEPDDQFFNDYKYLQTWIDNTSVDSRRLLTWHKNYVKDLGFAYLNSEPCSSLWSEIDSDELATIQRFGNQNLATISDRWKKTKDLREEAMIKNILQSCRAMPFERAAFLVGVAHRQAIIEKSLQYTGGSQECVCWDYSCRAS